MIVFRRRLIFWLIKAYIKKSKKILMFSFLFGLLTFFALLFGSSYFGKILPLSKKTTIGVVGAYKQNNLPPIVVNNLSRGLTSVGEDGSIKPEIASSWEIEDKGKKYIFHIKQGVFFRDGKEVTSESIAYNFSDVGIEKPDKRTLVFKLKEAYSPFLVTVSRPIFKKGFVGVGNYQIENVKLNGDFVQSLAIVSTKNRLDRKNFQFYPTEEALKTAYLLGEISEISGVGSDNFKGISFEKFPNTNTTKITNYSRLVTLFFNTTDGNLSDKKLRLALGYALPDKFAEGDRAYLPYSPKSIYYDIDVPDKQQDYEHAKLLMSSSDVASESANKLSFTIKTLKKYRQTADTIASAWQKVGVNTTVTEVGGIPDDFQIFLGDFNLAKDPDQYTLWHSEQSNNITNYKNLRIDKLLEDGRKTVDMEERKQIYADFQKYLVDDAPALFLYFPIEYKLLRK